MDEGGPSWRGLLIVCNAPQFGHWLQDDFIKHPKPVLDAKGAAVFMQPSGFAPDAENLQNLDGGRRYYTEQAKTSPKWMVDRLLHNKPGFDRAGKPIYAEYAEERHVAKAPLEFHPHFPLLLGIDGGGSPAVVFGQRVPRQMRWLRELCAEAGTGAKRFGRDVAAFIKLHFPNAKVRAWADPSAFYGGDKQEEGQSWIEMFANASGLVVRPAPTNTPSVRWESVRVHLTASHGEIEGFQVDPQCYVLREGFASGYRFRQVPNREGEYSDQAEKNKYSHPHDAGQYLCLGGGELVEILGRQNERLRGIAVRQAEEWDPLGRTAP
jgi:hypothetical protein